MQTFTMKIAWYGAAIGCAVELLALSAMTVDVVTGPYEIFTFSHASSVAYPWERYEYRVASVWNEITPVIFASLATAGAGAAAAADAMNGSGNGGAASSAGSSGTVQSYQGAGDASSAAAADATARSRASLDSQIAYYRSKVEHQRQNVANAETRLNEAAGSGRSTIALSQTVNSERTILRTYQSKLSQLESQRAGV